jgi:hypothetical protein
MLEMCSVLTFSSFPALTKLYSQPILLTNSPFSSFINKITVMKKKIIFIIPCLLCMMAFAQAQYSNSTTAGNKAEPTVNGKPYSQYKAEQDALKKQQEAQKMAAQKQAANANADIVAANAADAKPAPAKPQPVVTQQSVVSKKNETRVIADVPMGEGLTLASSTSAVTQEAVVTKQKELVAPATVQSNRGQGSLDQVPDYKSPVIKDANKSSGNESIEAKPAVIPSSVVSTETRKANPAPDVPEQFKLSGTAQSWTGRPAENKVTNTGDPAQSTDAPIVATDMNAYKAQQTANQKAAAADVIAKPKPVDASVVTTKEAKSNPAPEVPAQFKLNTESWNGGAVAAQSAVVRSDAAQSIDAKIGSEQYKAPSLDKANTQTGDEGKNQLSKPDAKKVDASLVNNAASKQADPAGLAMGSHGTGVAPAAQTQMNTKGTSLDPSAKATAPAGTVGQEGGGNPTPVPANTVKAPVKDVAPAPATASPAGSGPAGNSTSPAPVVPVETSKQGTEKPASKE